MPKAAGSFDALLADELWTALAASLPPRSATALRAAARRAHSGVDAAAERLLAALLGERPGQCGLVAPQALALAWRARLGASSCEVTSVAIFAAERGLSACLDGLASRFSGKALLALRTHTHASRLGADASALHVAADAGHAEACRVLLRVAAEASMAAVGPPAWRGPLVALRVQTARQRTPLHCAAASGDLATVEALLAPLQRALGDGDDAAGPLARTSRDEWEAAQAELAQGLEDILVMPDHKQRACALVALQEEHFGLALRLTEAHVSFRCSDRAMTTGADLLSFACGLSGRSAAAVVAAALARGADVNGCGVSRGVPLAQAASRGSAEALELLLSRPELEIDLPAASCGRTALHLACQYGRAAAAERLLERGASATVEAPGGRAALYFAAERGSEACVEALLRRGNLHPQDVLRETAKHSTPLSIAARRGHVNIAARLLAIVGTSPSPGPRNGARRPRGTTACSHSRGVTPASGTPTPRGGTPRGDTLRSGAPRIPSASPSRPVSAVSSRAASPVASARRASSASSRAASPVTPARPGSTASSRAASPLPLAPTAPRIPLHDAVERAHSNESARQLRGAKRSPASQRRAMDRLAVGAPVPTSAGKSPSLAAAGMAYLTPRQPPRPPKLPGAFGGA